MTALSIVVLLGITALAVDASYMFDYRNRMAAAADAAALAGGRAVKNGFPTTYVQRFAQNQAALNGFADGTGGISVTVNRGPLSGPYTGNANYVEVIIRRPATPTFFAAVLGRHSMNVAARAVAGFGPGPLPNIIALCLRDGYADCNGIVLTSTINVTANSGVIDNSIDHNGFSLGTQSVLNAPAGIWISDPWNETEQCTTTAAATVAINCRPASAVHYNWPATADPLAGTAPPSCGSPCANIYPNAVTCSTTCSGSGTSGNVLQPGDYQDLLTITNGPIYLNGGVYKFSGAHGFNVSTGGKVYSCGQGPNPTAPGCTNFNGVSLVNTENTNHGSITIQGIATLRAASSGILIYQCVSSVALPGGCTLNTQRITIGSGAALDFSGIIYAPTSDIDMTGGSGGVTTALTSFIVNSFGLGGNGANLVFNPYTMGGSSAVVLSE